MQRAALFARQLRGMRVPRQYAADVSWTLGAMIAALASRTITFVLVAQALGAAQWGLFVATRAMIGFALSLAGWGFGDLVVRAVSRDRTATATWWGNGLAVTVATGCGLGALVSLAGHWFIPGASLSLFLVLAATQLLLYKLIEITITTFRARGQMAIAAGMEVVSEVAPLLAAIAFWAAAAQHDAFAWAMWQATALTIAVTVLVLAAIPLLGLPRPALRTIVANLGAGAHFALADTSFSFRRNADMVLLSRFVPLQAVGIYSAATTVVNMTYLPLDALGRTFLPRFFALSGQGLALVMRFAVKQLLLNLLYGLAVGLVLLLGAPLIPLVLGESYASSVDAIRWLSLSPALFAATKVASMTLSSIDRPQDRTKAILVSLVLYVALAVWLMPRHAWQGAIAASLVTEALLAAGLWATILYWWRLAPERLAARLIADGGRAEHPKPDEGVLI